MTDPDHREAIAYASQRARQTGHAYIVSDFGRVLVDLPGNRQVLRELAETVIFTATP